MESDAKPEAAAKPKLKRRWFQFSIASLLFLIAICAVVVAFVVNPARRQRRAVEYVKNLGGEVGYANIRAVAVHRVLGNGYFRPVDMVCLRGTQVSDAGLAHLKGMNALGWLDLTGTQVSDAGVMHLKELTTLEGLDLTRTQVSDAGVLELKGSFAQLQDIPLTPATMPLRRAARLWRPHAANARPPRHTDAMPTDVQPERSSQSERLPAYLLLIMFVGNTVALLLLLLDVFPLLQLTTLALSVAAGIARFVVVRRRSAMRQP